jgi:hypothetical protein
MLRSIMLNHWYHHRGQLSVYLRLLDVPVPAIYGRSADENPFDRHLGPRIPIGSCASWVPRAFVLFWTRQLA